MTATTRYRLDLAYDGAAFHGWASQDGLRTVQGELEHWLTTVLRLETPAQLTVAGRTDAGVHARGQVAHVDLPDDDMPPAERAERLTRRLGRVLPPDVTVRRVTVAPEGFDARFSAIWRRYVYRLAETTADPLHRGLVHRVGRPLDVAAMDAAAAALVGLHDFVAFCKAKPFATTIRHVLDCGVTRVDEGELAGTVAVEIRADAFCHSMVRSVVGALVGVGLGQHDAAWLERHVRAAQRARDIKVMPARGLVLEDVGYPADDQLAARASQARARRDEQSCPDEPSSDQPNSEPPSSPEPPTKEPS